MKKTYLIKDVATQMNACGRYIVDLFQESYPETELQHTYDTVTVHVRNALPWSSGKVNIKQTLGLNACATLTLTAKSNDVEVTVESGAKIDKATICTLGVLFSPLIPLAFTSGYGFIKQNKLCQKLFEEATAFLIRSKA